MSEVVLLPITDRSQQIEGLCQALYYYQLLTTVNKLKDYVRGCSTTNYWPQSTNWRIMSGVVLLPYTDRSELVHELCQRFYYYHILTAVNKLTNFVRGCTTTKYWPQSTSWRIISEVLLLPNIDRSKQVEGLYQGTTKYWPPSTSRRIMSEVVLLPYTDCSQQVKKLCERLFYYQLLTAVNKFKDYVRGCTTTIY